jgi:hypothetical protein
MLQTFLEMRKSIWIFVSFAVPTEVIISKLLEWVTNVLKFPRPNFQIALNNTTDVTSLRTSSRSTKLYTKAHVSLTTGSIQDLIILLQVNVKIRWDEQLSAYMCCSKWFSLAPCTTTSTWFTPGLRSVCPYLVMHVLKRNKRSAKNANCAYHACSQVL